jgi:hypothetical protein
MRVLGKHEAASRLPGRSLSPPEDWLPALVASRGVPVDLT